MENIKFSNLGVKLNETTKEFDFNGLKINIKNYLPWEKKYDLVDATLQAAEENGIYNPIKLEKFFHLFLVYSYTDIDFGEEKGTEANLIYDILKSSGLLDKIILAIPEEEYDELLRFVDTLIADKTQLNRTIAGSLTKIIADLPIQMQAAADLINGFDKEKFQNIIDFAAAANGNRPIE